MQRTFHNYLGDIELKSKDTPGCRLYELPNGDWVPARGSRGQIGTISDTIQEHGKVHV